MLSLNPFQPHSRRAVGAWLSRARAIGVLLPLALPLVASAGGPLSRDPALTFGILLRQSLTRAPEYVALAARDDEARAHLEAGRAWLAGRPSLEASYLDDRGRSGAGVSELEYGVQLPLWRPGERRDAAAFGRALTEQAAAARAHVEFTVAGRLREALAVLEAADRMLEIERLATREAEELVRAVERLFEAGETSALDLTQARTGLLAQRRMELEAVSRLAAAEAGFTSLTGLSARPASGHREVDPAETLITPAHPWLRLLKADEAFAAEAVKRVRAEAKGNPALGLGARRQRGAAGEEYNDSLVVGLSLPFGGLAKVDAQVGSARRQQAEAAAAILSARRELEQRLDELQRERATLGEALRLGEEQVALDRRQWEMARAAFDVGETNLFQVLSALGQLRASTREREQLRLRRDALPAQINQTIGVLP